MPGGDRTGPWGRGPGTGRGLGYCSGGDRPGYMQPGFGAGMGPGRVASSYGGFGRGRGRGRGFRRFASYYPMPYADYPGPGAYPGYSPPPSSPEQEQEQPKDRSAKKK